MKLVQLFKFCCFFTLEVFEFLDKPISDGVGDSSSVSYCFTIGSEVDVVGFELLDLAQFVQPYRCIGAWGSTVFKALWY